MGSIKTRRARLACSWCGSLFREPAGWGETVGEYVCRYCGHPIHALARNAWAYVENDHDDIDDPEENTVPTIRCEICHTEFAYHRDVYVARDGAEFAVEACPKCGCVASGEPGYDGW